MFSKLILVSLLCGVASYQYFPNSIARCQGSCKFGLSRSKSLESVKNLALQRGKPFLDSFALPLATKELSFGEKAWKTYLKTTDVLTTLFPVWTLLFASIALLRPETFAWFSTKYFTASLGKLHFIEITNSFLFHILQVP